MILRIGSARVSRKVAFRGGPVRVALEPRYVEEMLRWATPVLHFRRTASRDVELRGARIHAGDKVVTWYISANFDETVFPDPYSFDITRWPNEQVTFGPGGPHFCLGAHLARLETRVLFQELLPRVASIELGGEPARASSKEILTSRRENAP